MLYCLYDFEGVHAGDVELDSDDEAREMATDGHVWSIYRDDEERGTRVLVWRADRD